MARGLGIDAVEIERIRAVRARHGNRFLRKVYTDAERRHCLKAPDPEASLAGRFAAKEAVLKVLGTGWRKGISWQDIEIRNDPSGRPGVTLSGECRRVADRLGIDDVLVSISHIETHAIASAIGCTGGTPKRGDDDSMPFA